MSEERKRILEMVADGRISAHEAGELLEALERSGAGETGPAKQAKFMYVKVAGGDDNVDVKVPLNLVRSGLRLTGLIPTHAMEQINASMAEHGMNLDFSGLSKDNIEELIEGLTEMEINVDSKSGEKIKVFCG